MPNRTAIEWADYSSNPVKARLNGKVGWACVRVSRGCEACYAATLNRRLGTGLDFTVPALSKVEPYLDERELHKILTFRPKGPFKNGRGRPLVFLCDMSDIFGEWVPDEWVDRILASVALRPDVDFVVLTKRAKRMREYMAPEGDTFDRARWVMNAVSAATPWEQTHNSLGLPEKSFEWPGWPLPNLWLGVSVENQDRADERIPELLATPAAVCFLSCEPLLAGVDLGAAMPVPEVPVGATRFECPPFPGVHGIDWVIAGGESGPKARPMDIAWIRSLRDQCKAAGVAFFMKQDSGPRSGMRGRINDDLWIREMPNGNP